MADNLKPKLELQAHIKESIKAAPLAELLRPKSFEDYIGLEQFDQGFINFCKNGIGLPPSLILWGPPGSGKTSIARIIANSFKINFKEISAVMQGLPDVRKIIARAKLDQQPTIIFVDEIHRFNKSQQDAFLPHVENGTIILFGATTENPSFYLNNALLSRCTLFKLSALTRIQLEELLQKVADKLGADLNSEKLNALIDASAGDARFAINTLEILVKQHGKNFTYEALSKNLKKAERYVYDRSDDNHYQCASAFIKSLRGSNPDAALFWGLHMLSAGEDPKFIFRRLIIFASEDIGNADPRALQVAMDCAEAFERLGLPEGRIPLAQCITYLATSAKSNRSYVALNKALEFVKQHPFKEVPLHLRNADTKIMRELNYGINYDYPHNHAEGYAKDVNYFPDNIKPPVFYEPSEHGVEKVIGERLRFWRNLGKS